MAELFFLNYSNQGQQLNFMKWGKTTFKHAMRKTCHRPAHETMGPKGGLDSGGSVKAEKLSHVTVHLSLRQRLVDAKQYKGNQSWMD